MEFVAPFFALFGMVILLGTLFALVITILLVLNKKIPNTDKLLMILMVWLIPMIGSIIALYMLMTQYKKPEEVSTHEDVN
jgi:hypothetical protein